MGQLDIISGTYKIRVDDEVATMFAICVDNRQYMVTAKHVAERITNSCDIELGGGWHRLPVIIVGHCDGKIDISVICCKDNFATRALPEWKSPEIRADLKLGESIRFYGFPYGIDTSRGEGAAPIPLVKSGIVSGFYGQPTLSDRSSFFIDGHNNHGFSGGPVVSTYQDRFDVAGVVSGFIPVEEEVIFSESAEVERESGMVKQNTGIFLAWNIQYAVDVIRSNPIGLEVN